jgi:hypothetical protein
VAVAFDGVSAENIAALVAAVAAGVGAVAGLVVALVLTRRVRELREIIRNLGNEAMPLVRDARVVMDHAATEMERVGDVLATTEAVSGTVDSASRLAYRIFANPVVKSLAFGTGARSAFRRLFSLRDPENRQQRREDARARGGSAVTETDRVTERPARSGGTSARDGGLVRGAGTPAAVDAGPATGDAGNRGTGETMPRSADAENVTWDRKGHRRRRARRLPASRDSTSR